MARAPFSPALIATVVAVALIAADAAIGAPPTSIVPADSVALERVPYRMDDSNQASWWKPIAVRGRAVYAAFNGPRKNPRAHLVWVARRSAAGEWERGCLPVPRTRRCVEYRDDPGHNQPTIAVDGDGYLHVFAGMHHNTWRYFRSDRPGRVDAIKFRGRQLRPWGGRFTYPVATTAPNGDVWLIVRQTKVDPFRTFGRIYRWSVREKRWFGHGVFARADGHGVYPADIVASADGLIHIVWAWSGGPAAALKHHGSYAVYNPTTRTYANAAGEPVPAPMTPDSPVLYQPLEEGELWAHVMDGYGELGADLALAPVTGRPVVAYRYQAPADGSTLPLSMGAAVRIAAWSGADWERQVVYDGPTAPGLGITFHGQVAHLYYESGGPDYEAGSLAVVRYRGEDYVYRAVPRERALYVGRG